MTYLADLAKRREEILEELNGAKAALASVDEQILAVCQPNINSLFELQGKQGGTVTGEIDGLKVKGSRSKTVKWDSDKLRAVARTLPVDQFERYFDMKLSVPEKGYNDMPQGVRAMVDEARTVQYGDLKVSIET